MSIYAVCLSVIKSCTYWDSSTLQALHEHACLLYKKCNVDCVGKLPSNITVWSDFKSFCLWLWITSVLASTGEGEGCGRLTIFMQSYVPLGPGKFHVVFLVTYRWPIDYSSTIILRAKDTSCFLVSFFFVCDSFICARRIFLVSEVRVDVETQSANHKYRWFSIVQFAKLNNVDEATIKVWFNNKRQRDTGEPYEG